MITDYHAKLFAHELLRRHPSDSVERVAGALADARVDLNPHQVDAALFAFRSPLSKGAILADEVGLGKTIEAGIVLSQWWAEKKRKILIVLPSSLRKQWHQELQEKFYLPSEILEARTFSMALKKGKRNPFDRKEIVVCSYHFARNKAEQVRAVPWDLVVFDEAHRLRNVYKSGNKIARELKDALAHAPKLLLTATPLQNTLLELYGLAGFIDDLAFGDLRSFRAQYARLTSEDSFDDLKRRLKPICKRTLRRQVLEYIRFTERKAHTQEFVPTKDEEALYEMVSEYLRRPNLRALPASQRTLMTLVLRKLLASSTFAIAGALDALANKLERRLKDDDKVSRAEEEFEEDFERLDELADELETGAEETPEPLTEEARKIIQDEIADLRDFYDLAMQIAQNAKGEALLKALEVGFRMTRDLGGAEKAIVFTESRRTQNYLLKLLSENGYAGDIVLFNGSNNDVKSRQIYAEWKARCAGTDKATGSRTADGRAALVDYFRESARLMIATEAAAEGINLQFCSQVVNYDLPWNPQRIEQRIGRCHRYGQERDVVVVNFLNKNNAADQRVYQLLSEKFRLFSGVFGASDEVLGSIESGVDFEKRIAEIYQTCRTQEEIQASFDALQAELAPEIDETLRSTRQKLLENFDAEVAEKLSVFKEKATEALNRYEALLWDVTRHELDGRADFDEKTLSFMLERAPVNLAPPGMYKLKRGDEGGRHYRLQHPLAQWALKRAAERDTPEAEVVFDLSGSGRKISALNPLVGKSGVLMASWVTVTALETEDHLIYSGMTHDGVKLDSEQGARLFSLPGRATAIQAKAAENGRSIAEIFEGEKARILQEINQRNAAYFDEEALKLDKWSEDLKIGLEQEINELNKEIKEARKASVLAQALQEKVEFQKTVKALERKRSEKRKALYEEQDAIDEKREKLISEIERRMRSQVKERTLFTIQWKLR